VQQRSHDEFVVQFVVGSESEKPTARKSARHGYPVRTEMKNKLAELGRRFLALFHREQFDADLEEEMRLHQELREQEQVECGVSPEEAHYSAQRRFGNRLVLREESRDIWGWNWLETFLQDIRYGLRQLRRSPSFTAVAVVTLALGIGATTAIFSVVNSVLLQPLSYPHSKRLVNVSLTFARLKQSGWALSAADYFVYREQSRTFEDIGLYSGHTVNVMGSGSPERVPALDMTDDMVPILGVTPLFGRFFTQADERPGSPDTMILTYGYWRSKFAGKRSVVGRTIDVDGKPHVIIGVLPEQFHFLDKTKLAMLLPLKLNLAETYVGNYEYEGIARLKPGVTLGEANADVARMIPIVLRSFPVVPGASLKDIEDLRIAPYLRPLKQQVVGDVGKVLWVLMGGISLVLVIACANVANLSLVKTEGSLRELAIRAALGASRGRIAAKLLSESLILGGLGGWFGLGLAYGALRILVAMAPTGLPRLNEIGIDGRVVLFTIAVSVAASLLFGSVPVFRCAGADLGIRLRESGRSRSDSRGRHRSRSTLVIVQVALALVLMVSSGLMIRTFRALTRVNPGFITPSEVQTFAVSIPDTQVRSPERVVRIEEAISEKIAALPGVSSVGISNRLPMDGSVAAYPVFIKAGVHSAYSAGGLPVLHTEPVPITPGFLKTLGTPLVAGRDFTWSDIYNEAPVAMVSENFAREYWHDPASALGKQIRRNRTKGQWRNVVGVVADVYQDGVDKEPPYSVYWPILMANYGGRPNVSVERNVTFAIRTPRAGSESFMNEVRRAVWSVDPNLPLFEVHTLDYNYTRSMARTSFTMVMLAIAGGMALLIGVVGLYGVIAYSVLQRTHEIGMRMALGAQKHDVVRLVLSGGMSITMVGVGIGIASAVALTRFLSSLLYGVKPTDPLTFIAVSLILIAVALLASYIPARQAAKVDPMVALRYE
jgi:predicted permease